jgi:hypothetical protein
MTAADASRTFQTRGYALFPDFIAEDVVTRLRTEAADVLDRLTTDMSNTLREDPRVTWWRLPTGEPYVFKIKPVLDLAPTAEQIAHDPELTAMVAELLGGPPHLMEDKITYKQRVSIGGGWPRLRCLDEEVHKHSDAAYFHARGFRDPIITLAICLDDAPAEAGAVRVWPGSHRRQLPHLPTPDHGPVVPDAAAPDEESVTLDATAGSVLAWDARLVHASGPNTTRRPRRLLILGYVLAEQAR